MQAVDLTLAAAQAAGLLASIYNPIWWANFDAKAIRANGSQDSLLSTFHRQRGTWRVAVGIVISALSITPLLFRDNSIYLAVLLFVAQLAFNLCYFFAEFNPRLNVATGATYKSQWYVSWNPLGSWTDRFIWGRAWKKQGFSPPPINGPSPITQELAGEELRYLSAVSKWLGYTLYLLFAIAGYSLSYGF